MESLYDPRSERFRALMHFAKPFDIDEIRQAVREQLAVEA